MATPSAGMGLTAQQQTIVDKALQATAPQSNGTNKNETTAQLQANFASFLTNPANQVAGGYVMPSGSDFTTGATSTAFGTASTQQIEKAVDPYLQQGGSYAPGVPGLIAAVNGLFNLVNPITPPATATAPAIVSAPSMQASPVPASPTALTNPTAAPVGSGTPDMSAPNPNPAVTGDNSTTTATTATTGQNLASAAPGTILGDLLSTLSNSGSNATSQPEAAPSTILPTDTSGGVTSSGTTASSTASSPSTTDIIVYGVIASLIAAAIWYFFFNKKGEGMLHKLEKDVHV